MADLYEYSSEKKRRIRKPTWTDKETRALVTEFDKRKEVLRPKVEGSVRTDQRQRAWLEICREVNVANPRVHRTVSEAQKKWQNLCITMRREFEAKAGPKDMPATSESDANARRNELENFVIQDIISSERGLEDETSNDLFIKIENVEGGVECDDGDMFSDEINDRSERDNLNTPHLHDRETNSNMMAESTENHRDYNLRTTRKRLHDGDVVEIEIDPFEKQLFHLKKQKIILEMKKCNSEIEKLQVEKEKLKMEKEKFAVEKEKLALQLDILKQTNNASPSKNPSNQFDQLPVLENATIPSNLQSEQFLDHSVKEKALLERERIHLENEKLKLELQILRNSQKGGAF